MHPSATHQWIIGASTLGAPGEDLSTVLRWLADAGAGAVELRVAPGQAVEPGMSAARRESVRALVADSGIEVLGCASYVHVGADRPDQEVIADLQAHLRLAHDVGARFLRVFPGAPVHAGPADRVPVPVAGHDDADARIVRRLAAAVAAARLVDVAPLLETHDSHPRGEDVARVLDALDLAAPGHPVGALWDAAHPFRTGEQPRRTWEAIGNRILGDRGYVQVKDMGSRTDETPVLIGHGIVPLAEIIGLLAHGRYRGPLCLEWERTWYPDVEALPTALDSLAGWLATHPVARTAPAPTEGRR